MPEEYLKSLIELSKEIFNKAETIKLDPKESWNEEFFKKQWFEDTNNEKKYITQSPGWYWIGCDIDFKELSY